MVTGLHNLDLGAARFIELELSLALHQIFDLDVLKSAALTLVTTWPALSYRMNFTRTKFVPSPDFMLQGLWKARKLESTLDEALPHLQGIDTHLVDSTSLNQLVSFNKKLKDQLFPRALTIGVASLRDACLIQFTVQHPFCDASGVYRIVDAYCALLAGRTIDGMGPRLPLKLREEIAFDPLTQSNTSSEPTAARHKAFYAHGWSSLLAGGLKQKIYQWSGTQRVEKLALIPNFVIDQLAKDAEAEGIRVTRHDLLMAWIYIATMPEISRLAEKKNIGPPQFSFVLNISKLLQHDAQFHNPWIVVTVPDLETTELYERSPVLAAAKNIRATIVDARQLAPVKQILDQHSHVRDTPIGPVGSGCLEPNVAVSSWTNLPLYDIEFVAADGSKIKPAFVQVGVKACPLFRSVGLPFADGILTWVGKEGFWIQGNLYEASWEKIDDFRLYQTL